MFSDSLYEVIRYYPGRLFRPEAHIRRLNHGARHLALSCREFSFLIPVVRDLIAQNHLESQDVLVYIHVTRGVPRAIIRFRPRTRTPHCMYVCLHLIRAPGNGQDIPVFMPSPCLISGGPGVT